MHVAEVAPQFAPVDEAIERLEARRDRWMNASFAEQAEALDACRDTTFDVASAWVARGHEAKSLPADHPEEWLAGPVPLLRGLRLLSRSLRRLHEGRSTIDASQVSTRADGRTVVDVFPVDAYDSALLRGYRAHEVMREGQTVDATIAAAGRTARARRGGLCGILGAGNVASIPALDALTSCVNHQVPAVVKVNPVNEWVGPFLQRALAPLIEMGAVEFAYGGAEAGRRLVEHPDVTELHMTGSDRTYDAIVWGPGAEGEEQKRSGAPRLDKPLLAELGNISPVAIVPGVYTDAELDFIAHNLVAMVTNNASFNCAAAKIVLVAKGWHQADALFRRVEVFLRRVPTRHAYYPGARDRYQLLTEGRPGVERIGRETSERLPWTLIRGIDPNDQADPIFRVEPFCSVLSWIELEVPDSLEFIDASTRFMNERIWGTLNATMVMSKDQTEVPAVKARLDQAVDELRYGTVAINHWPALAYAWGSTAWGGYPGSAPEDIQSGTGWVHNTYLLEGIEKTVVRGPMPAFPKPLWFADHHHAAEAGRRMVAMEHSPSWLKVPGLAFSAILG